MTENNPYAPPKVDEVSSPETTPNLFYAGKKYLNVKAGAELPHRCFRTNQPVENRVNGRRVWGRASWCNLWWALLLFLNPVLGLLVMLFVSKKVKFQMSVSDEVLKRRRLWLRIWVSVTFGGVLSAVYFVRHLDEKLFLISMAVFLLGLICLVLSSRYFRAKGYRNGWFALKGCHPDYLKSLREESDRMPLRTE